MKLILQTKNTDVANGVIGVVDCPMFEPINNKQGWVDSPQTREYEDWITKQMENYYFQFLAPDNTVDPDAKYILPDTEWVQCNQCLKWRKLPADIGMLCGIHLLIE